MMKKILNILLIFTPWKIRRKLLELLYGYKIHPTAHIGFSYIYPRYLEMGEGSTIDHLNVAIHLDKMVLGKNSSIGRSNWITGFPTKTDAIPFSHDLKRKSELVMGDESAITKKHHIDCTNAIHIGNFVTIAGYSSQLLTHSIDIYESRQDSRPITIGDYCFVSTRVVILGGAVLPSYSVLAAGAVLTKSYEEEWTVYGGVPAERKKSIDKGAKYFSRRGGVHPVMNEDMKINYFKPSGVRSIRNVFIPIIKEINKTNYIIENETPSMYAGIRDLIQNGMNARRRQRKGFVNHITGADHFLLLFLDGKRTVVTVHDIMHYFDLHGFKKFMWKWFYIYPLKRAAKVVFISKFAQEQTLKEVKLKDYCIIENPLLGDLHYVPKPFNHDKPVVMHIGTADRKNLSRSIVALKGIKCHLRIIGNISETNLKLLHENGIEYSNAVDISNEEVAKEYENCNIVNFPSTFEGFGMPVMEGQKVGRIVLTSNIAPMVDVAAGCAVIVDPFDVESIRNGYLKILGMTDEERQAIIDRGLENCKRFDAEVIAQKYMDIYKEIEQNNK